MITVDGRWTGRHGIARFAQEVVPRLRWRSRAGGTPSSPTSPLDVLSPWRLRLRSDDVVYSPGFNAGVSRARQILTLHDLIHLDEPAERSAAKSLYYDLVVKPVVRRAGLVLTVSSTSQHRIQEWLGDRSAVEVMNVGNGCSAAFLRQPRTAPPGRGRFLYVGNLKPHKNVDVLFEALARRPDYELTLVTGDADRVRQLSERYRLDGRVTTRSGLTDEELASLYRNHDAVLQPSKLEGFGLPALEALAVGRRVGFSGVCASVREIVGGEGTLVDMDEDPDEWAGAMDRLLEQGPSVLAESEAWRAQYGWDGVAGRVSDALEPLINRV